MGGSPGEGGKEGVKTKGSGKGTDPLKLRACHLIEEAEDETLLWCWSYPEVEERFRGICLSKCRALLSRPRRRKVNDDDGDNSGEEERGRRMFFHLDKLWYYVFFPTKRRDTRQDRKSVGVIVAAEDFHPELYDGVADVLYLTYMKSDDPSIVLQQFLSLIVEGMCLLPKKKTFSIKDYEFKLYSQSRIKEMINMFGLETILIYSALEKRRRIALYHYDTDELAKFTLSLPAIAFGSNITWNDIFPWVNLDAEEVSLIKELPFYIMGCPQADIEHQSELYDVFVNIPAAEISIAPRAKDSISMNKMHKDLATFMVQLASKDDVTEDELVAAIKQRAMEIKDKA